MTLEEILMTMKDFGIPRVSCASDGTWMCTVQVHTKKVGASFEIRSEFTHPTPLSAAKQCYDRLTND